MTQIVQMLDNDAPIEEIFVSILTTVGIFMQLDFVYLCAVDGAGEGKMDVIAEWHADGLVSDFEGIKDQPRPSYLYGTKPLVVSSSSGREDHQEELDPAGIKALAAFPVTLKDRICMYVCFEVKREDRTWSVEEIKFLNDSVKVLQSILTRRIQKNSLAGSYSALEEILNNVGSSIYVKDKESGKLLFANRYLKNRFRNETEQNKLFDLLEQKIPQGSEKGNVEVFLDDRGCWYDLFYKYITWVDGRNVLMCSVYDVTEKKMYQKKIERLAYTDSLTGLYNRPCCERDLAKYVDEAKKNGQDGAVLYMDLDDFGTGYSSLSHIRNLPFDVIKVDQSFVRDLSEDSYSKAFIRMVSDLAEAIDVSICVEGIETEKQYRVLEGMNVRMIQGYYFDRPMPAAEFQKKYVV